MSKQLLLKIALTTSFGLATGFLSMHLFLNKNTAHRGLASQKESPFVIQKLSLDMVSRNYFQIKLTSDDIAEKQDGVSTIKAVITAYQDIPAGLAYKWNLEKGATSHSTLEGVLPAIASGDTYEFQITTQNFSHEVQNHISISLSGKIAEHIVQRDAIIASRPEDSFEYVLQKAAEQRQQEPQNMKIQQLSNGQKINDKFRLDKIIR